MPKVVIVLGDESASSEALETISIQNQMLSALKQAIALEPVQTAVEVLSATQLTEVSSLQISEGNSTAEEIIWCPLTFVPDTFLFSAQSIYQACQDVSSLRQWVADQLGYAVGGGDFWLPVVLTAKGAIYGEVIGKVEDERDGSNYRQPVHLADVWRQPLYQLGYRLLQHLSAPPSVYLLQFGFQEQEIVFDRLWPFPAEPAVASVGIQEPNLFSCHWRCLTGKPIIDLTIPASATYQLKL